jgi:ADP-heptose:LPS heptosyltransferase
VKISTMRQIDRLLGVPACIILTVIRKLHDVLKGARKSRPDGIKSILFVKLAEQGATVLADSAIRRAVEIAGRDNVYFLVFEQNRFILDVMNIIPEQNVLTIPDKDFTSLASGAMRAISKIRKLGIDAAVDFEFFARSSAILTYLSGAKVRVGLHGFGEGAPYRGDLMTHRLNFNPHLHTSRMFEVMVEAIQLPAEEMPKLNLEPALPRPVESRFVPDEKELEEFKAVLEKEAGTSRYRPLILLNANASDMLPLRKWPGQRYAELAKRLLEKSPEVHVAFTGAPSEAEYSQKMVREINSTRCFSMTGRTTMRQLMMLYCLADVLVTNDSGPAHFATLTDIEVITLFGPETPKLFGAQTPRSNIIWKGIACSPCVSAYNNRQSACKDNICMQKITVDEVFNLLCRLCKL